MINELVLLKVLSAILCIMAGTSFINLAHVMYTNMLKYKEWRHFQGYMACTVSLVAGISFIILSFSMAIL